MIVISRKHAQSHFSIFTWGDSPCAGQPHHPTHGVFHVMLAMRVVTIRFRAKGGAIATGQVHGQDNAEPDRIPAEMGHDREQNGDEDSAEWRIHHPGEHSGDDPDQVLNWARSS